MNKRKIFTLTIGAVTNNGKVCPNPLVDFIGKGDFELSCPDPSNKSTYRLELFESDIPANKELVFAVRCAECDDCGVTEIIKTICSDDTECSGCSTCIDGICETVCLPDEICYNDKCVECSPDTPCPNGQVCKNGRCVCPQSAPFKVGDKCFECLYEGVQNCKECREGFLIDIPCTGACDPDTNQCVDCLTTNDCDGANECCNDKTCDCCTGFVRDSNGNCIPKPECDANTPCGPCSTCIDGNCEQIICPAGKVCIGEAGCVEECDCNTPYPCNDLSATCFTTNDGCGCIPCQGDCDSGCSDGCYCNGTECIGDICFGGKCPCTNGADCPEGYGCDGGNCVPCASLDCTNSECSNVLGCGCANDVCVDSDNGCGNSPCTTSDDCAFGCACDEGICKSCDNYSCAECGTINGCGCTGLTCEGAETNCVDVFELEKSDEVCSLTATLTKGEDCACPPLTVNVKVKKATGTALTLEFLGEVRKGLYTGSLDTPLLDNVTSPLIVENDAPTSGRITISSVARYREYDINPNTGVRSSPRIVTEPAVELSGNFVTGSVASLNLGKLVYKSFSETIVTERDEQNRSVREIKYFRVDVVARITDDFDFPNECTYKDGGVIGSYRLTSDADFNNFGFGFGNHVATTITSAESRLPIFRWFKSVNDVISDAPFRKLYVAKSGNEYVDVIGKPEGLDACKYYKVLTDCSCTTSPDIYAVFCNPEDIEFETGDCNRSITIDDVIKTPCEVNSDVEFYLRAGSVYQKWLGARWDIIAGRTFFSSTPITEVEFGQVCDTQNQCKKVYQTPFMMNDLDVNLDFNCESDGVRARFTVPSFDLNTRCAVQSLTVDGTEYFPGQPVRLNIGTYTYIVAWQCGCDPLTKEVVIKCCDGEPVEFERFCNGQDTCVQTPGYTYKVGGDVILDVCAYVRNASLSETIVFTVSKLGCPTSNITLPSIANQCCFDFEVGGARQAQGTEIFAFVGGDSGASLTISRADGSALTTETPVTGGSFVTFTGVIGDVSYVITAVSSIGCSTKTKAFAGAVVSVGDGSDGGDTPPDDTPPDVGGGTTAIMGVVANSDYKSAPTLTDSCGQNTSLERILRSEVYTLESEVTASTCACPDGLLTLEMSGGSIASGEDTLTIFYGAYLNNVRPYQTSSGSFFLRDVDRGVNYPVTPNSANNITFPINYENVNDTYVARPYYRIVYGANRVLSNISMDRAFADGFDLTLVTNPLVKIYRNFGASNSATLGTLSGVYEAGNPNSVSLATQKIAFQTGNGDDIVIPRSDNNTYSLVYSFGYEGTVQTLNEVLIPLNGNDTTTTLFSSRPFTIGSNVERNIQVQLVAQNITMIDGCTYSGSTPSVIFNTSGVVGDEEKSVVITSSAASSGVEFSWRKGGAVIQTAYSNTINRLENNLATLGDDYSVTTVCSECIETQTLKLCNPISGNVAIDACLEEVVFNMTVVAGKTYSIVFNGAAQTVTAIGTMLSATFVGALTENTPYNVTFTDADVAQCVATLSFNVSLKDVNCP